MQPRIPDDMFIEMPIEMPLPELGNLMASNVHLQEVREEKWMRW
jgi:hypothetical protein